jgi:Uncharacterized conserved protein (DUF2285)
MSHVDFLDQPPSGDTITAYDRAHLATYLRLLDAERDGACWEEVVQVIFRMDPAAEHDRARQVHQAHLERAQWMTEQGYCDLLRASHH